MVGTIRLELRSGVAGKNGRLPISLIYSLGGVRKRYSLGCVIFAEYWNAAKQSVVYIAQRDAKKILPNLSVNDLLTKIEVDQINNHIETISSNIKGI